LREHAGKLLIAALWASGLLSEIGGTAAHHTTGYFQGLFAVHVYADHNFGTYSAGTGNNHRISVKNLKSPHLH
jgi:hypothetical protein